MDTYLRSTAMWYGGVGLLTAQVLRSLALPRALAFSIPSSSTDSTAFYTVNGPAPSVTVIGCVAVDVSPSPSVRR